MKITYFGHFYVKLGPNLKQLFSVFIILGNQYRPQTITLGGDGKGQEVNRRKLPPIGLTPFELAPTLMNNMGVVQNFYHPNGDRPTF